MKKEQAMSFIEALLDHKCNDIQTIVFVGSWENKTYQQISLETGYKYQYIKQAASALWRSLSKITGENIRKDNLHLAVARYQKKNLSKVVSFPSLTKNKSVNEQVNSYHYHVRVS